MIEETFMQPSMELERLAGEVNREHKAAAASAREVLDHAVRAGELLLAAKKQVRHGEWLSWFASNFEFTARTGQNYMRLAQHWSELQAKNETVLHLSLRDALALLAPAKELKPHEYCLIFPPMTEAEFEGLKQSIAEIGLLEKIMLYEGQILDGKERYRACLAVGVEPQFEDFEGDDEKALAFCLSANLYRQHVTPSQCAAMEAELRAARVWLAK